MCVCLSARTLAGTQSTIIIYQEPLHIAGNYFDIRTVRARAQHYTHTKKKTQADTHTQQYSDHGGFAISLFIICVYRHTFSTYLYPYARTACGMRVGCDTYFVVRKVRSLANLSLLICACARVCRPETYAHGKI